MAKKKKSDESAEEIDSEPEAEETSAQTGDTRDRQLAEYFKLAQKNYGKGSVKFAVDHGHDNVDRVSTGILPLDVTLGGGLPVGRFSMVYGPRSSSKTTTLLRALGRAQRMCSNCWTAAFPIWKVDTTGLSPKCKCGTYRKVNAAWLDVEGVWDEVWSRRFLDISRIVFSSPTSGEDACDIADSLLRSGMIDIIVVDSVAFLQPMADIERSAAEPTMGTQAKLTTTMVRKLVAGTNHVAQTDGRRPSVWVTNQIRNKIGVVYGNPESIPGGFALGFATSTETRMSPGKYETDKGSGIVLSVEMNVANKKNKTAVAHMEGEYKLILHDTPFKKMGDVYDEHYAIRSGAACGLVVLKPGPNGVAWNGKKFTGKAGLEEYWMTHRDEYEAFKLELMAAMRTMSVDQVAAPDE